MSFSQVSAFTEKIADLPESPTPSGGYTHNTLKEYWDKNPEILRLALNVIVDLLNNTGDGVSGADSVGATAVGAGSATNVQGIIEEIHAAIKSIVNDSSGADYTGATPVGGGTAKTTQGILEELYNDMIDIVLGQIPDESLTSDKLGSTAKGFYADISADYGDTILAGDMQDVSVWTSGTGTQSADSVNVKLGDYSLKILENDNTTGDLYSDKNGIALDFLELNNKETSDENDYISLICYVSDANAIDLTGGISIRFSQDTPYTNTNRKMGSILTGIVTGWNFFQLKKSSFSTSGSGAWDGIQSIRLNWKSKNNYQNEYISFQLVQLIKKDPSLLKPNPFQKFGVNDFEINSCEWFVGKEFDRVIIRKLSEDVTDFDALSTNIEFSDFILGYTFEKAHHTRRSLKAVWYIDDNNNIMLGVIDDTMGIMVKESGSTTIYDFPLTITLGDTISATLQKIWIYQNSLNY